MNTGADRKLLALGVKSAKFTAKELQKVLDALLKAFKDGLTPTTSQKTYEDFHHPGGVSLLNVSTEGKGLQGFSDLAHANDVNVSLKHNEQSGTYYLCLQGPQKYIKKTVEEYQAEKARRSALAQDRISIQKALEQAKTQALIHQQQSKPKTLEKNRSEQER